MRKRAKIIVIDDDVITLNILMALLKCDGYQVRVVSNAANGLQLAKSETPDLIILDVHMPDKDGLTALSEFRKTEGSDRTRVLMLTSENKSECAKQAFQLGADGYVVKPFERRFLQQKISEVLNYGTDQDYGTSF